MVLGTAIFTVIEVVFLAVWLALARSVQQAFRLIAPVVLFVGLVLEHIVQFNTATGRRLLNLKYLPLGGLIGFSAVETVIWVAWLPISLAAGNIVGFIFLVATLIAKHAIADNVIAGRRFLAFRYGSSGSLVTASVLEAIGGQAWLINVLAGDIVRGIVVLAVFSFAEHLILILLARRQLATGE